MDLVTNLPRTPWEALERLANELEKQKDAIVHEHFTYDPSTGVWECANNSLEAWVTDREELIEEIRTMAIQYYVEV